MFSSNRVRSRGSLGGVDDRDTSAWQPGALGPADAPVDDPEGPAYAADVVEEEAAAEMAAEARAAAELQARIDNAYERGYEDGRAEGRAVEAARVGSAVQAVEEVIARFESQQPAWLEATEKNMVALATAMAREVIGRELEGSVDDITALVRRAVSEFPITAAVKVRLNPADLTAISSPLGGNAVEPGRQVRWIPDPDISAGGCVVEGPATIVDGRVEKALDRIYSELIYG